MWKWVKSVVNINRSHFGLWLLPVISCRYDIKSTETLFDNATRSRIVSTEKKSIKCYVRRNIYIYVVELTQFGFPFFVFRWLRLFPALSAVELAKPLVRSNFSCGFILLSYIVHMHIHATSQHVCDTALHFLFSNLGINSLLARGVYDSAFPLHDVSITEKATSLDNVKVHVHILYVEGLIDLYSTKHRKNTVLNHCNCCNYDIASNKGSESLYKGFFFSTGFVHKEREERSAKWQTGEFSGPKMFSKSLLHILVGPVEMVPVTFSGQEHVM